MSKKKQLVQAAQIPLLKDIAASKTETPEAEAIAIIQRMQEIAQSDPKATDALTGEIEQPTEDLCQLDLWPETHRGSPNEFLRSSLFAAIQSENRQQIQTVDPDGQPAPKPLATQRGFAVTYSGEQLDQYDFDVWLQAIHYAKAQPLGTECLVHGHAFLKEIGRTGGQINYETLYRSLKRLTAGLVVIKHEQLTFTGHLISSFVRDENTGAVKITFAEEILKLFGYSAFTRLQWEERRALKGKALALWLHGFYSSHARPYPLTVDYLRRLSGSRNAELRSFREKLKRAFRDLEKASGIRAVFIGDKVAVERPSRPFNAIS